jgi:hypothetical protein
MVIFGLSTSTKSEKLKFYSSNILNSLLVPLLNSKSTTFSPLVPVQSLQEIEEKNSKKGFLGICTGVENFSWDFYFWTLKKNFLKTKLVPGTKYGVFQYLKVLFDNMFHIELTLVLHQIFR